MSVLGGGRGEVHLGDLIVALASLGGDDPLAHTHVDAIAGCLGFGVGVAAATPLSPTTPIACDPTQPSPETSFQPPPTPHQSGVRSPSGARRPEPLPEHVLKSRLKPPPDQPPPHDVAGSLPAWFNAAYRRIDPIHRDPLLRRGLLPAHTARGVLTAALASWRPGDQIDLDLLVRQLVEQRLPPRLPRLSSPTLSSGCQLLLDFSGSMVPWWEDLRDLTRQVKAVLGEERVDVFDFRGEPDTAGHWRRDQRMRENWQPEPGRPILVATDFGIRGESVARVAGSRWRTFVDRCARHGCRLRILVPWPRDCWPHDLGLHPQLVHWDPSISAGMLHRQRPLTHRIAR